ncbi:MAG TPA: hypothetical protein VJA21_31795 [Verrucomicrobiae bacterium]
MQTAAAGRNGVHQLNRLMGILALTISTGMAAPEPILVLKHSDVVFMYQAPKGVYDTYGATVLAWGGTPTAKALEEASGLKFFGSVGMVTEFARYYERFPETYERGLCRNLKGEPFKVPWLTDHQHKGVPFWWCCTRQPVFRQYISERVVETIKAGSEGVHIDDHLGTAGALFIEGGCFCAQCVSEFRDYLKSLSAPELTGNGVRDASRLDYADVLRKWLAEKSGRKVADHPLWNRWRTYQLRGAAAFMNELRTLAARTAGKPIPMSANACLMWGPHLSDYLTLDYFSAEIEHHAAAKVFSDEPLAAYRIAEAVNRPLAATASGGDWAFVKENNLPGLVQSWVALSYAAGQSLMAPHRQWCYTPQKGTHWYEGPSQKFAPLYRFVRRNASLFDGYATFPDLIVAYAQLTFDRDRARFATVCHRLAAANLSFRLALGGDEAVEHALSAEDFRGTAPVLVLEPGDFQPADKAYLASLPPSRKVEDLEAALAKVTPAVRAASAGQLRVLPRVKPGSAIIHLVNWNYDATRDAVEPVKQVRLNPDLRALGVPTAQQARVFAPGAAAVTVQIKENALTVPEVGLWAIVELNAD